MIKVQKRKYNTTDRQHEDLRRFAYEDHSTISYQLRQALDQYAKSRKNGKRKKQVA